jgi:hypothetical protein
MEREANSVYTSNKRIIINKLKKIKRVTKGLTHTRFLMMLN